MLTDLFQVVIDGVSSVGGGVADMLPTSPFRNIRAVTVSNEILANIAWLVPFNEIIALLSAWLSAIVIWYISKKALRWMKIIQ